MGRSSHPDGGYDKRTQAADVRAVLAKLNIDRAGVVGHDIGTMVAYAYAVRYPDKTDRLVVMDGPVPGIPHGSRSFARRRCGTSRSAVPMRNGSSRNASTSIASGMNSPVTGEATRVHYAKLYAPAVAMDSAFAQFLAFPTDTEDNLKSLATKLNLPASHRRGKVLWCNGGNRDAQRCERCERARNSQCGSLADGGAVRGHRPPIQDFLNRNR
jgi:pimeloyl-ACP methyl ester carboxylesterase